MKLLEVFCLTVVYEYMPILMLRNNGIDSVKVIPISQKLMFVSFRVPLVLVSGLIFSAHIVEWSFSDPASPALTISRSARCSEWNEHYQSWPIVSPIMIGLPWKPPQLHADTTWASYCFVIDNRESVLSPYQRLQYFVLQQVKSVASVRKSHWYLVHKILRLLSPLLPHIQNRALSWVGKQYANKCLGQWNWLWEGIKWPRIEDKLLYWVLNVC
jgi:hypothetical protein